MNTFDRHLLREWLQILAMVLVATCGLMLVQVLYDKFRWMREHGADGRQIWEYVGVTIPSFFAIVLPLALLISLLFVLGKLHRANELTAMRAAGVSFMRITAPLWVVGVACCGLSWWLNTRVVPWSVERSRSLEDEVQFVFEAKSLPADRRGAVLDVAFDNRAEARMWFFNRYSQFTQHAYGVSVSELDARRRETSEIIAAEAWYDTGRHGWMFINGRRLTYAPETGEFLSDEPFTGKFVQAYDEKPDLMLLTTRRPIDLSLHELRDLTDYLEAVHSPKAVATAVRYYGLIADTLVPLIVIAISIPFAVSGVRVNPAVGVSKSIGLFMLYYAFATLSSALANQQVVDPVTAAWLPNIGMSAIALWFFARLR